MRFSTPLCVHKRWQVRETAWIPVWLSREWGGTIIIIIIVVPPAFTLVSMQQTALSSQKPLYHLVFLCIFSLFWRRVEDYVFSCIISLLPKCHSGWSAGKAQLMFSTEVFFFPIAPSLKQYEHSFCSSKRSHPLNTGRSPHCVCVRVWLRVSVHVSVNALGSFQSWVDVLGMVLSHRNSCVTSSFFFLLGRHGDRDGNAGKTLRLCCVMFFQHGQGVVLPLFMSTLVIQRKAI